MSNLYTIIGNEKLLINEKINQIEDNYKSKSYEKNVIDLKEESIITLLNALTTIPFLDDYRLVILKNPVFLYNENSCDTRLVDEFFKFIENPLETTILITIVEEDKGHLISRLKSNTNICEINNIDPKKIENLEEYVDNLIKKDGYTIEIRALKELLIRVDHDYNRILIEIEKLEIYKTLDKNITYQDVVLMVSKDLEDSVYPLIESIISKNKLKSMEIYKSLKKNNIDESSILASLISKLNEMYQVKELVSLGYKKDDIAQMFKYKPGRVYYLMKDAQSISHNNLKNSLKQLMEIDYDIKSGRIDKGVALELYILKM